MIAWVLILGLGFNNSTAISGIASEEACKELQNRLAREWTLLSPSKMQCFPYQTVDQPRKFER